MEIAQGFNLTGKNAIVTGGYAGIGRETVRVLAIQGAHVYVAGRDMQKCNKAVEELKKETGKQLITPWELDLASLESVRKSAAKFNQLNIPLHYLILNAGVMACPYSKTKDGFELQIGTNFYGHFLFTNLLVPSLLRGTPSRVVSVASSGHHLGGINFDDIHFEKSPYNIWTAYGQSKTANILFAVEFNRRYKDQGVTANSLHPGGIQTELDRHVDLSVPSTMEEFQALPGFPELLNMSMKMKTIPQGAATTIYAALSPDAEGGKFYNHSQLWEPAKHASDPEIAKKLWDVAAKAVGL